MAEIRLISTERILVTGDNPRQAFDEESLRRLGETIRTHGLLQPIIVRPKGDSYELIVGERRLRAAQLVGLREIRAEIRDVNDAECFELRLIENTHREDLTYAEKGDAIYALMENYPEKYPTIASVAEAISTPYGTVVSWTRQSRKLSDTVRRHLENSTIKDDQAASLLAFSNEVQDRLVKAIVERGLNILQTRKFIKLYKENPSKPLEKLIDEALEIKPLRIDVSELSREAQEEIEEIIKEREKQVEESRRKVLKKARKAAKKAWETRRRSKFKRVATKQGQSKLTTLQESELRQPNVQVIVEEEPVKERVEEILSRISDMDAEQREKKLASIERVLKSKEKRTKVPPKPTLHICPRCNTHIWLKWDYIVLFDKTPPDIVCPHFYELRWAFGCPYQCSYCYLQGTFYGRKTPPRLKYRYPGEKEHLAKEVRYFFEFNKPYPENFVLNTGELADSLMDERRDDPFSKFIIPLFEEQNKHKVLFLTKSDRVENLLEIDKHNQAIISFSINVPKVASRYEFGAPSPEKRIEAAALVQKAGYSVRVRIDPMIPIGGWEEQYLDLLDQIFERITPERITLGTLRGLNKTLLFAKGDTSWKDWLLKETGWGLKLDDRLRAKMYRLIIDRLHDRFHYNNVALCKETKSMWDALKMDWMKCRCNCVW